MTLYSPSFENEWPRIGRSFATAAALLLAWAALAHAQGGGAIRGRVLDRSTHHGVPDVEVIVSSQAAAVLESTHTDNDGRYVVVVREPSDAYVLAFRRVGYAAVSKVVRRVGGAVAIDVEDVELAPRMDILQPVVTRAAVLVPLAGVQPASGATEFDATSGRDFTVDPSDLAALIALLPGVQAAGDSGSSVLGAPPDQNRTIVDGVDFSGGRLPRDAIQRTTLVTNTFDPSQGRFSGGEAVATTRRGTATFDGALRAELVHPSLSWSDPRSTTNVPMLGTISAFAAGPLRGKDLTYFAALDLSRRSASATSLLAPRPGVLSGLGILPDTVSAVTEAAKSVGIASLGTDAQSTVLRGSAFARADLRRSATTSFTISSIADWTRAPNTGVGPLSFPSTARSADASSVRVLLSGESYVGHALDEIHLSASSAVRRSSAVAPAAAGVVQVGTSFDDGRTGFNSIRFGGAGSGESMLRDDAIDAVHETSWVAGNNRHQIKLTQEAVLERHQGTDGSDLYGTYSFASLSDLLAEHPSAYTRSLSPLSEAVGDVAFDASLGDAWHAVPGRLEVQGGLRLDVTHFTSRPALNADVDSLFELRTDRGPNDVGLSPRLGFVWRPAGGGKTPLVPNTTTVLGCDCQAVYGAPIDASGIAISAGADAITISGGLGAFRGTFPLSRAASLLNATGLPNARQSLACVGDATPRPDWSNRNEAFPVECRDASGVFADADPDVAVLSPGFRAPVSWRGSLAVGGIHAAGLAIVPQLMYSIGTNGEDHVDANLVATPAFTIGAERNRPVFVPPSAIDPGSGLIRPGAGRLAPNVGHVTETMSDLESHAGQFSIAVAPRYPLPGGGRVFGVYTLTRQRFLQRGFDGTSSGDPRDLGWVTGGQPLHQIIIGLGNIGTKWLRFGTRISTSSGSAFTPTVAQDINGDGRANDRAFITEPGAIADSTLAGEMRALLSAASPSVRRCLERQLASIAGANSCRTGWRAQVDLSASASPPSAFGFGDRLGVTAAVLNAGTALVRLFHLENTPFGRSSRDQFVDQRLLYVTGFDEPTRHFVYRVNQQFGQPVTPAGARGLPPFELQLGVQLRLGPSSRLATVRTSAASAANDADERIRADLVSRFVGPDPVAAILTISDSLQLDVDQRDGIRDVGARLSCTARFDPRADRRARPGTGTRVDDR